MSEEAQAGMVLALGDAVDSLIEHADRQQKVVQEVLSTGSEALKAVSLAGNEHRALARELPKQVKEAISVALDGAATKAAEILSSQFSEADEQARLAAERYESVASTLRWKLVAIGIGVWAATTVMVVLAVWYMSVEVRALREDRGMLEATVAYLKQHPQGAHLSLCNSQNNFQDLCVSVQTAKNKWEWQGLARRAEKSGAQ